MRKMPSMQVSVGPLILRKYELFFKFTSGFDNIFVIEVCTVITVINLWTKPIEVANFLKLNRPDCNTLKLSIDARG